MISNENLPESYLRKAICIGTIINPLCNFYNTVESIRSLIYIITMLITYSFIRDTVYLIGEEMFKKYIILLLLPIISFASVDKYVIDKTHFAVGFLVEHVGYAKTLGMFRDIDGSYT